MNELLGFVSKDMNHEGQLAFSEIVGAVAGGVVGGEEGVAMGQTIARSATEYNRQLHADEIAWINEKAEKFAKEEGISSEDAKARLAEQALRDIDVMWDVALGADDTAAQKFMADNAGDASFINSRDEQQKLFSTQNGDYFDPTRYATQAAQYGGDLYDQAQNKAYSVLSDPQLLAAGVKQKVGDALDDVPENFQAYLNDLEKQSPSEIAAGRITDPAMAIVDGLETGTGLYTTDSETLEAIYGEGNSNAVSALGGMLVVGSIVGDGKNNKNGVIDDKAKVHILDGDGANSGGHRYGTGKPGKTEFPEEWSDQKVESVISNIVTDPTTNWSAPDKRGYIDTNVKVENIDVQVVYDTKNNRVVTGYPTNTEKNPK